MPNLPLAPSQVEVPPLLVGPPRLTHAPMTFSLPAVAPAAAEAPPLAIRKVRYWLADLFEAPRHAYQAGYQVGYQAGYQAGQQAGREAAYQEGYQAGLTACQGGGHTYPDRPRSVWEFRDLYDPDPERFAALVQRYGGAKRPLAEWLALLRGITEEL